MNGFLVPTMFCARLCLERYCLELAIGFPFLSSWTPEPIEQCLQRMSYSTLGLPTGNAQERISGLGGLVDSVVIETKIKLMRETAAPVLFSGRFAAVTNATALDISVLGRDITDHFAVIVDRPQADVCLVSQRHSYTISHR